MNSSNPKLFIKAIGTAIIVFLIINIVYFIFEYFKQPADPEFALQYKHGQFSLSGQPVGIELFSRRFWIGILLMTVLFFLYYRKQEKFTNKKS